MEYPRVVTSWINDREIFGVTEVEKINPATEEVLGLTSTASIDEVVAAIESATKSFPKWSHTNIIERAKIIRQTAQLLEQHKNEMAEIVRLETGKSRRDALAEISGAVELGYFIAGEGQRFYGQTTTSAMTNRFAYAVRQPVGICALITSFNTPIANAAWKIFPALVCGNTAIMKPSPDTPFTSVYLAKLMKKAGLPNGVLSIIQGDSEIGKLLVDSPAIDLISFTGSSSAGRYIAETAGKRLARVCLELGGKNPLVVCDDADLNEAIHWTILSAFSNAGQRCASASRIIIFSSIYEKFKEAMLQRTKGLLLGISDTGDLGPVINQAQLHNIIQAIDEAIRSGAVCLIGGKRIDRTGYYVAPTILENVKPEDSISQKEIFGPVTCLYRARDFEEAIEIANSTSYGLTGAIHTSSIHRIQEFTKRYQGGVVSVNGPTHGSEPHMPFGGIKNSGNGWREPGLQALDAYSEWKTVYVKHNPQLV